jgi:hypothetical protein
MPDNRTKSVRMDEHLHQMLKTLCGYLDLTMDEVIAQGANRLWKETFPGIPLPGESRKPKGKGK